MAYPEVPSVSKNQIRAAGDTLISDSDYIGGAENARKLLSQWRAGHLLPLDALAKNLQTRLTHLHINGLVGLRLKRLFRIVSKLKQFPAMNATTMQDIAGLRAILPSITDANALLLNFREHAELTNGSEVIDYISQPKDSGYRSVHIAFRFQGDEPSPYDGLRVELQIRTDRQHLWASAVEVTGMWQGQHIKYDEGDPEWAEFFAVVAEINARVESTPPSQSYSTASLNELTERLRMVENQLDAIKKMRDRSAEQLPADIFDDIPAMSLGAFLLFEFHGAQQRLSIRAFESNSQEDAILSYAEAEERVTFAEGGLAPLLVSVNTKTRLRDAYRTFFLDLSQFADLVQQYIAV